MFASQFENEENAFDRKRKLTSALITALIHGVLLLVLFFFILHTPVPPFEDNSGGMSVNYGTDATGVGDIQPFTYNPGETATPAAAAPASVQKDESTPESAITQDKEETDVVAKKVEEEPKPKVNKKAIFKHNPKAAKPAVTAITATAAVANPTPAPPKPDANAMFSKGAYGKPNNSQGDGTGGPQGDQGKPNGDPNSRNYLGDGSGNGTGQGKGDLNGGYSLTNRKRVAMPSPTPCSTPGKVVIKIKVDRTGHVVEANFNPLASQSYDDCNKNNALIAARQATFNPAPNAPEIQEGTITYIYRVH